MVGTMQNLVNEVLQSAVGNYFRNKLQTLGATEFIEKRDEVQDAAEALHPAATSSRYEVETRGVYIQDVIFPADLVEVLTSREIASQEKADLRPAARGPGGPRQPRAAARRRRHAGASWPRPTSRSTSRRPTAKAASARAEGEAAVITTTGNAEATRTRAIGEATADGRAGARPGPGQGLRGPAPGHRPRADRPGGGPAGGRRRPREDRPRHPGRRRRRHPRRRSARCSCATWPTPTTAPTRATTVAGRPNRCRSSRSRSSPSRWPWPRQRSGA